DWSCDPAPNDVVCDYLGAFPVAAGSALPDITVTETLNANPAPSVLVSATAYSMYEQQATYTNNFATDTIKTSGTGTTPGDDLRLAITHTPSGPFTSGQTVTFHLTAT